MTNPAILGSLSHLHEMQVQLMESASEDSALQYHDQLGSLNWLLGRGVYLELLWLREMLGKDSDLSIRVEHLFNSDRLPLKEQCVQLPSGEHLLNWASQIWDEHLMRLANPAQLPYSELLVGDRLQWYLLQEQANLYEDMLLVMCQRSLQRFDAEDYRTAAPLRPVEPRSDWKELSQGHYRIGARDEPRALDFELPPQAVELSSFRIALSPVSNAEFLAFIEAGGYKRAELWTPEGEAWRAVARPSHPEYWRQDKQGDWIGIGINGPYDLQPNDPVSGISQHEAIAYANWVGGLGGEFSGAVLQHEYQWEIAVRTQVINQYGSAWEWCSNPFHSYPEFKPFPGAQSSARYLDGRHFTLRGASLHTHPVLRRPSYRHWALPDQRFQLSGIRLVYPPMHRWT